MDSNHRPHAYQACALTTWAMRPILWWRWGGSNSWPPACKAGALPAELHPHNCLGFAFLHPQNWTMLCRTESSDLRDRDTILWHSLNAGSQFSLERRWSSRTFRYGYLVTTSPQSSIPPSTASSWKVRLQASGVTDSHGVTGGVYKARERIHRGMLIRDY